jgi:hypothetical protein
VISSSEAKKFETIVSVLRSPVKAVAAWGRIASSSGRRRAAPELIGAPILAESILHDVENPMPAPTSACRVEASADRGA